MGSPAMQSRSTPRDWWEVTPDHVTHGREAAIRANAMSASPIGKQIDGTQGLYAFVAKGPMQKKRTVRES